MSSNLKNNTTTIQEILETANTLPIDIKKSWIAFVERKDSLVIIPDKITSIGDLAFIDSTNLMLTSLPNGITSIGTYAFYGCVNLSLTSLPSNLTSIGSNAFRGCIGLTTITFEGTPNTIDSTVFNKCTNLKTINVPWSEGAVANAPWGATNATINYNYAGG